MAEKKVNTITQEQDVAERARGFWVDYSRPIIYAGSAIILIIGGWFAYKYFIKVPREKKGNEAIFMAENIFDKMANTGFSIDSSEIVLNGGNIEGAKVTGLLSVIKNYGGTSAGNRARYMAGATYLHLKKFDKAVDYLKEFDGNGAHQVQSKAYIMLGHAYAEQNKTGDALEYYKKAADVNEKDDVISADALITAATYAEVTGKTEEAVRLFKKLKEDYPNNAFVRSGDADKNLARLGVLN